MKNNNKQSEFIEKWLREHGPAYKNKYGDNWKEKLKEAMVESGHIVDMINLENPLVIVTNDGEYAGKHKYKDLKKFVLRLLNQVLDDIKNKRFDKARKTINGRYLKASIEALRDAEKQLADYEKVRGRR